MSGSEPSGVFPIRFFPAGSFCMIKAAILIDGGYFLKRLPVARRDIDTANPDAVARSIDQLVRSHLNQLNDVYGVGNVFQLLYRCFISCEPSFPFPSRQSSGAQPPNLTDALAAEARGW